MALDPSIALNAGNRRRRDPSREYANALAIKQAQGQIEAQKADRARTEAVRNALAGATKPDGSVDYGVVRNVLLQHGDVSGAMGVDKTQADMATSQTTSELKSLELAREKIGMAAQLLGSARDDQTYQAALQRASGMGLPVEGAPAQFDPAWVQQTLQQTLTAKEQLDAAFQERKFAETQRHNRSTEGAAWVRANRPDTVVNMAGETAYEKEFAKLLARDVQNVYENEDMAQQELSSLRMLKGIQVDTGKLEPAKAWLASLAEGIGVSPELTEKALASATNAQSFQGIAQNLVLTKLQAQKGPQTENDARRIESTVAQLGNTPAAKDFLIESAIALKERDVERARFYRQYESENGNMRGARQAWSEYIGKTPLLGENPKTGRPVFYPQFRDAVRNANPDASEDQILNLWRKKYGR